MKKLITILCAIMLTFSLSAQRQGDTKIGMIAGANYAIPVGNDMEDAKENLEDYIDYIDDQYGGDADGGIKARFGFHLGMAFDYYLADNFALATGLSYSQKGFRIVQESSLKQNEYWYNSWTGQSGFTDTEDKSEIKIVTRLDYLDLPVTIKYQTDEGFNVFGGLLIAFLVGEEVEADIDSKNESADNYGGVYSYSYDDSDTDDYEDTWGEDPEGTLMGFMFGIGYDTGSFNIAFKLNKTGNFGELNNEDDNQNLTLQLSTGIYF